MPELSAQRYSLKDGILMAIITVHVIIEDLANFGILNLALWLLFGTKGLRMSSEIPPEVPLNTNTCCFVVGGEETQKDDSFDFKPFCTLFFIYSLLKSSSTVLYVCLSVPVAVKSF
jgi:hypothetical protein